MPDVGAPLEDSPFIGGVVKKVCEHLSSMSFCTHSHWVCSFTNDLCLFLLQKHQHKPRLFSDFSADDDDHGLLDDVSGDEEYEDDQDEDPDWQKGFTPGIPARMKRRVSQGEGDALIQVGERERGVHWYMWGRGRGGCTDTCGGEGDALVHVGERERGCTDTCEGEGVHWYMWGRGRGGCTDTCEGEGGALIHVGERGVHWYMWGRAGALLHVGEGGALLHVGEGGALLHVGEGGALIHVGEVERGVHWYM